MFAIECSGKSDRSYDPQFGARAIKRTIQKELMNELRRQIIAGKVEAGILQVIDVFDGKIVFRKPIAKEKKAEAAGA